MIRYIAQRLLFMLATFLAVVTVVFFLLRLVPGGPFDGERSLPVEVEQNLRAKYNLDAPLTSQFAHYVIDLAQGDLGPSFRQKDFTVNELIANGLPVSLTIGAIALIFAFCAGSILGIFAALYQGSWIDTGLRVFSTLCLALPPLVSGPLLVLVVAVALQWLPAGGISTYKHYVLPSLALSIPYIAAFARLARSSFLEIKKQQFVLTAQAKGLSPTQIAIRHVLRSAATPVLSFVGPAAAALLAGSMIVEEIFAIPGLGRFFVHGAIARDYTLVMGAVLIYAALILVFNFVVDVLYPILDPRIRNREANVS